EDNDNQVELDKCTICQDYIRENSIVRQINKCKHTFHIECADRWFQDKKNSTYQPSRFVGTYVVLIMVPLHR
ncbi:MAG: hypothetical protein CMH00_00185, partial [Marinovum sp.]|nr:hypothetical protein [Marinovum sp.]